MLLAWPKFEPMNSRSEVHHANHYTIEASYNKGQFFHDEHYNVLLFCEVKIEMPVTYNKWILGAIPIGCDRATAKLKSSTWALKFYLYVLIYLARSTKAVQFEVFTTYLLYFLI